MEHIPAACERVSACGDARGAVRDADCFERGPVPFADFLYHENRRLELERPRTLAPHLTDAGTEQTNDISLEPATASSPKPADGAGSASEAGDRKSVRRGAIVMNFSRPTLVAKFIDLYA